MTKLKFQFGNAKLSSMALFSLPAGHSCPFAKECFSRCDKLTGKIIDGSHCRFRCFAAMEERMPAVRNARWYNFELIRAMKKVDDIANLIAQSLPSSPLVRIHPSGDFFSEKYFLAWVNVAYNYPLVRFYAYTKALPFWQKYIEWIPANLRLIASFGGTHDHLISRCNLRYAKVVFSQEEADDLGLQLDHDDKMAYDGKDSFGLLLHGSQPAGTDAAKAWYKIVKAGGGYSLEKKRAAVNEKRIKIHVKQFGHRVLTPAECNADYAPV